MRVLFLTSTLPRYAGDMQANFVGEQAAAWKAERPDDEVIILAPHDQAALQREEHDGVEIVRFRYLRPARWQALAYPAILPNLKRRPFLAFQVLPFIISQYSAARRLVRARKVDLIYAHWVMPQGLVAWCLHRSDGVPFVVQNHSSDLRVFAKFGSVGKLAAQAILRSARRFFCVNPEQRKFALDLFTEAEADAVAQKMTVLPMGVQTPNAPLADGKRYAFGTIGRLSKKKGLHHFIAAAEKLAEKGMRPQIAIAGDGEDAAELKAMVRRSDIRFPGFLTGPEKDRFFDEVGVFVMPSAVSGDDVEGMPVALLEALCRGKTTIASRDTNIASLPEWPAIEKDVVYLEDPSDVQSFGAAMGQAQGHGHSSERLRSIMSRYWWPNLINEYLRALDLQEIS